MKRCWPTIIALFLGPTLVSAQTTAAPVGEQDAVNPVPEWVDLALHWIGQSERGPTISGHFLVMTNAALFDAWAAYEPSTTGAVTDLDAIRVDDSAFGSSDRPSLLRERSQAHSMTMAAFRVLSSVMGPAMITQSALELEEEVPEIAEERLAELLDAAQTLKAKQLQLIRSGLDAAEKDLMDEVSNTVHPPIKEAIKARIRADGSNFQRNYTDDTTGYAVTSWIDPSPCLNLCLPGDGISNGTGDYDFTDSSIYTYNTFNARLATDAYTDLAEPPAMQIHPLVLDGTLRLTETWQGLTQTGTFPGAKDGGEQFRLTPHWGGVTPFSLPTGSVLRSEYFGPYDADGNLRQQWIDELTQLLDLAEQQQGGTCPRCRAESEYWELGDEFKYPPGWWAERANEIVKNLDLPVKESLQVSLGVSLAVFDAGIAAWDMKYFYDSVRPVTAINEMFYGSLVSDWTGNTHGNKVANLDERNFWRPYQLRRNSSPPFPDVPSGHSAFSSSAMVVLRLILETNVFDFVSEPFKCRFDTDGGFDGDETNGNEYTTLDFKYLTEATDAAGFSRLLGGIHMMQGNMVGLEMGTKIGHGVVGLVRDLFGEDVGDDPVDDIDSDIVFGTGGDDEMDIECNADGNSEAYGYYGADTLQYMGGEICGKVTLFGGDDADTFRVGDVAVIGDYEVIDTIILIRSQGTLSRQVIGDKTTVMVDGSPAVILEGEWDLSSLNIEFEEPTSRDDRSIRPRPTNVCLTGPFSFEFEGECSRETLLEAYKDQVYSATGAIPRDCTFTAEEDFQAKLDAAGTTAQEICDNVYDTAENVPFTDAAKKGKDMHFEQMFFNGRSDWQEEIETIYESDDESATSVLKRDAENIRSFHEGTAQGRRVAWPGDLTNFQSSVTDSKGNPTCTTNAAMCCWPKDRQANDGNGNCAKPYDVNCVDNDPADNTDLCYVDMEKGNASTGFDSELGFIGYPRDNNSGEGNIHCHGLAWSNDANDATARYRGNNLFYVAMYDHMYVRGYVENVPGAPMCGCVEQMPTVSRSDCTQVDLVETIKINFDPAAKTTREGESEGGQPTFTGKLVEVDLTFNACRGIRHRNNDLYAYMAKLFYQGDLTPSQFGEAGQIITNTNCDQATRMGLNNNGMSVGYDADAASWTQVAGRDDFFEGEPFGYKAFMDSFFVHSLTAPSEASIQAGAFPDGETPIMMRICYTCVATHRYIFYRRLTPMTDDTTNLLTHILYHSGNANGQNVWNVDFSLHSTYEDALSGDSPWQCPDNAFNYDSLFTGDCSPDGSRVRHQHSFFSHKHNQQDMAYYVNKPLDEGVAALDLESSLRFSSALHTDVDLGAVSKAGRTFETDDGAIHITAGGHDIWHYSDYGHYFSEVYSGDVDVKVHVSSFTGVRADQWGKAGIMLRADNSDNAANVFQMLSPYYGVYSQKRLSQGRWTEHFATMEQKPTPSAWLRVLKIGDIVQTFYSSDGTTWTSMGQTTIDFPEDSFRVGLAVTSHDDNWQAEATFEDYTVEDYLSPTAAPTASAAPTVWDPNSDVGGAYMAGLHYEPNDAGIEKIRAWGSGLRIESPSDSFFFHNTQVDAAGGFDVEIYSHRMHTGHMHARGGIMIRGNDSEGAAYAFLGVSGYYTGVTFQSRAADGELSVHHQTQNVPNHQAYMKLSKSANSSVVTAYYKLSEEDDWIEYGTTSLTFTGPIALVGQAVTAGSEDGKSDVWFEYKDYGVNLAGAGRKLLRA